MTPASKYRAIPTTVDGIRFHSRREADRYGELKLLERAGAIKDLELQPKFPIVVNGQKICEYWSDFQYTDCVNGEVVTEDVKSPATRANRAYRIKKKLVEALFPVQIQEV